MNTGGASGAKCGRGLDFAAVAFVVVLTVVYAVAFALAFAVAFAVALAVVFALVPGFFVAAGVVVPVAAAVVVSAAAAVVVPVAAAVVATVAPPAVARPRKRQGVVTTLSDFTSPFCLRGAILESNVLCGFGHPAIEP